VRARGRRERGKERRKKIRRRAVWLRDLRGGSRVRKGSG